MRRFLQVSAAVFFLLSAATGWYALRIGFVPQADFDVLGILWLLTNFAPLMAWVLTFVFAAAGVWCVVGAHRRRHGGPWTTDEQARLAAHVGAWRRPPGGSADGSGIGGNGGGAPR